jgi:hypothetical protein
MGSDLGQKPRWTWSSYLRVSCHTCLSTNHRPPFTHSSFLQSRHCWEEYWVPLILVGVTAGFIKGLHILTTHITDSTHPVNSQF